MKLNVLHLVLVFLLTLSITACSSSDESDTTTATKKPTTKPKHIVKQDIIGTWKIVEAIDENGDKLPDFILPTLANLIFTEDNKHLNKVITLNHSSPVGSYKIENDKVNIYSGSSSKLLRTFQMEKGMLVDRSEGIKSYKKQ